MTARNQDPRRPQCHRHDISGQKFNRLTVIEFARRIGHNNHWRCLCECGNERVASITCLRTEGATECFQCSSRAFMKLITKHGQAARKSKNKLYSTWEGIKMRCFSEKFTGYDNYGGRGITMCPQWVESFSQFAKDIGDPPTPKHTVDRIDVNGNYEPGNVRWATREEQANNRTTSFWIEHNGIRDTRSRWSKRTGIPVYVIRARMRTMSIADALTKPYTPRA